MPRFASAAAGSAAFLEALRAPCPPAGGDGSSDMYSGLIGDWDAEVVDHLPDGTHRRQSAEMHFAWVLEGRAIQDVWIAPARRDRLPSTPIADGNRYGTTLRVYDPGIDAWRVSWSNPVTGVENRLVGRRVGSRIVQTGADADGRLIRWVFDDVRADAFHWRGERSADGGRTWTCDTEFFARRRPAPSDRIATPADVRLAWRWTDRPGLEALRFTRDDAGATAEGDAVVVVHGEPASLRYRIRHDVHWRFREARIETVSGGMSRAVDLRRDEKGRWTLAGAPRPDLDGCEDLDLMATPYTNTPPLAARPPAPGRSLVLRVAWLRFPDLDVHPVEQEYTRLDSGGGPRRYRYRNLESGFVGELTLDSDGLVIDYGPWKRR